MKMILNILCCLGVALILWLGASWVDIVWDNCDAHPEHGSWNAFVVLMD